jgi:hypothetical protein
MGAGQSRNHLILYPDLFFEVTRDAVEVLGADDSFLDKYVPCEIVN